EACHAIAADVQYRTRCAVQRVMVASIDMPERSYVGWQLGMLRPPVAAEQKTVGEKLLSRLEKKLFHTRFAVGQTVAEKRERRLETRVGRYRMMDVGIEPIVNGYAVACAELAVCRNDRRP